MRFVRLALFALIVLMLVQLAPRRVSTQSMTQTATAQPLTIAATSIDDLRVWDDQVTTMLRAGGLRRMQQREDTVMPSREHDRLAQFHDGIPVFGAEVTRQTDRGVPVSMLARCIARSSSTRLRVSPQKV